MSESKSLLDILSDLRLSQYATAPIPVWLWSADATRILWGNPAAAAIFNAASPAALTGHTIDPKGTAALQIARLAGTLPHGAAPRLERLRGFGGRLGGAMMCGCSRIILTDRTPAILVVASEAAGPKLDLADQAQRLLAGIGEPAALFSGDGALLHATPAAQIYLQGVRTLADLGAMPMAATALAAGRALGDVRSGRIALDKIGGNASTLLLAMFSPAAASHAPAPLTDTTATVAEPAPIEPASAAAEAKIETKIETEIESKVEPEIESRNETKIEAKLEHPIENEIERAVEPKPETESAARPEPESGTAAAVPQPPAPPPPPPPQAPPKRDRQKPLRVVWQMDADNRFTINSDEFITLIGPRAAAELGKPWADIAGALSLDPDGLVARAIASRDTWSGVSVAFPVDGSPNRLTLELSGLPVFDRDRNLRGYRGFGICRDVVRIAEILMRRRAPAPNPVPAPPPRVEPPVFREEPAATVAPPPNVVPFPTAQQPDNSPSLTPVEHKAFSELASRLTERLRGAENIARRPGSTPPAASAPPPEIESAPPLSPAPETTIERRIEPPRPAKDARTPINEQRPILDRLPVGVLVYRLDRLIYANTAFLDWTGYGDLRALEDAGGLDALFVEPGKDENGAAQGAQSLTIATNRGDQLPVKARLFTSPWEGESALVLMLTDAGTGDGEDRQKSLEATLQAAKAGVTELRSILDTALDGVVVVDREGQILSINQSGEALFGYESRELNGLSFANLFAKESQAAALDCLAHPAPAGTPGPQDHELIGRRREGSTIPLLLTVTALANSENQLCAVFRDMSPWKKTEGDLVSAKRQAENASAAKSDFLAKISHEIRTPMNAIIGFSEVMMQERFGPVGNERYKQYLHDIHASGGHVVALLNDLLDLSKIEAGKLELDFAHVDLNALTQQCVTLMQPQANRERIIIRTSLPHDLPQVTADARSVRQIVLNLLSNSIKFTNAGGQVIVSTALSDERDVVLRVRDTGVGMSEQDLQVAMEPFRQLATSARWGSGGTGLGLPLTKALAEANRARFRIRSAVNTGTLVEVAFPGTSLAAE